MSQTSPSLRGLAVMAVALLVGACGEAAPQSSAVAARNLAQPAAPAAYDTARPGPHWLPQGAVETTSTVSAGSGVTYFTLPGRANAEVVERGQSLAATLAAHPETGIEFRYGPTGSLPPALDDPVLFVVKPVLVAGSTATVVEQDNGLGDVTLTWHASQTEFELLTHRLATADGESGVGDDILIEMADSVR